MRLRTAQAPLAASHLLGWIAAGSLFIVVCKAFDGYGHLPASYDSIGYLQDAKDFYKDPSLATLASGHRPIFSWPVVLAFRLLLVDPTYGLLCFANALFSFGAMLLALIWFDASISVPRSCALFSFAVISSMSPVLGYSSGYLGDILASAVCISLTACMISWHRGGIQKIKQGLAFAGLTAVAVNTKPVCILWAGALLFSAGLLFLVKGQRPSKRKVLAAGGFGLALLLLVGLVWPKNLKAAMAAIYFNNEVLDAFQFYHGWLRPFWFPLELLKWLPIPQLLSVATVLGLLVYFGFHILRRGQSLLRHVSPLEGPWCAFLITLAYSSLVSRSSNLRNMLFLFPIFFALVSATASRLVPSGTARKGLEISLLSGTFASLVLFCLWGQGLRRGAVRAFDTLGEEFHLGGSHYVDVPFATLETSGTMNVIRAISMDVLMHPSASGEKPRVLLLNFSALLNEDVINRPGYALETLSRVSESGGFDSVAYHWRLGAWNHAGGIPQEFVSSRYVVYCKSGCWTENPASERMAAELTHGNASYWSGFTAVESVPTTFGEVQVLRRDHAPDLTQWSKVVHDLALSDPDNLWNYPFVSDLAKTPGAPEDIRILETKMLAALKSAGPPIYLTQVDVPWTRSFRREFGQLR